MPVMRFVCSYNTQIHINIVVKTTRQETSSEALVTYLCRDFPRSQQWQHFRRL